MKSTTVIEELNDEWVVITTKTYLTKEVFKKYSDAYFPSKDIVRSSELTDGVFQESADIKKVKELISEASGLNLEDRE